VVFNRFERFAHCKPAALQEIAEWEFSYTISGRKKNRRLPGRGGDKERRFGIRGADLKQEVSTGKDVFSTLVSGQRHSRWCTRPTIG